MAWGEHGGTPGDSKCGGGFGLDVPSGTLPNRVLSRTGKVGGCQGQTQDWGGSPLAGCLGVGTAAPLQVWDVRVPQQPDER